MFKPTSIVQTFWLAAIGSCLATHASGQAIRTLSLDSVANGPQLDKTDASKIFLKDVGIHDQVKRLQVEDVLTEFSLAGKVSSRTGANHSTVLRDLITFSSSQKITSSLAASDITARAARVGTGDQTRLFGSVPRVDTLGAFGVNVVKSFGDDAQRPGFLRVWEGVQVTKPDPYPDAVLIVGNNKLCTGSLITGDFVVTAAHCFCEGVTKEIIVGTTLLDYVYRSEIDVASSASFIPCDDLNNDLAKVSRGDIALYKLRQTIDGVPTRQIAREDAVRSAASVRAVGYGKTQDAYFGAKFTVDIVIASYDCSEPTLANSGAYGCASGVEMIAAGMNRDTCAGDSGGPIYVLGQDVKLYIAAVTSRSIDPHGGCGQGGIYVKLTPPDIHNWLAQHGVPSTVFGE
jgi:Trypsin